MSDQDLELFENAYLLHPSYEAQERMRLIKISCYELHHDVKYLIEDDVAKPGAEKLQCIRSSAKIVVQNAVVYEISETHNSSSSSTTEGHSTVI